MTALQKTPESQQILPDATVEEYVPKRGHERGAKDDHSSVARFCTQADGVTFGKEQFSESETVAMYRKDQKKCFGTSNVSFRPIVWDGIRSNKKQACFATFLHSFIVAQLFESEGYISK